MDLDDIDNIIIKDGEAVKTVIISKEELISAQKQIQDGIDQLNARWLSFNNEIDVQRTYYDNKLTQINNLLKVIKS